MEKILVTGGTGLVSSAISNISHVYKNKYEFIFMNSKMCNLLNYDDTLLFFQKCKPDYVIHLAANVGGLFKNMEQPVNMLEDNLLMNINVLKVAHIVGVKKLIACLSTCIFPNDIECYPIKEEYLHLGPPHYSNEAYAYSKRILQTQCMAYKKQYNDNFVCIIPTNIYGKNDNFHLNDAHVIPALIHKCFIAKQNNDVFVVAGTGKPMRQFVYSDDLAKMILWMLNDCNEEMVIFSSDEEISINNVAKIIAQKFNYADKLIFDESKSDGQYKKTVSNELFKKYNKDFLFTSLENGISETIDWFLENYDIVRK